MTMKITIHNKMMKDGNMNAGKYMTDIINLTPAYTLNTDIYECMSQRVLILYW